jgi:phospholipid/cholesterol/gamma-HCH transport system substrate-binding protein
METQQRTLELKVGAFIVVTVVLMMVALFAIGDVSTYFEPAYRLRVLFDSANGISEGSPVQYAGVEVGKVEDVQIVSLSDRPTPKVELILRLPTRIQIHSDDEAAISTFGLLGEKYLQIIPGPGQGAMLKSRDVLIGKPPVSTEHIIERSNEVLTEFKRTLEGLNSLVADPEARIYLKEAMREARDATRNWKIMGERLNVAFSYAESGQGTLGKLIYEEELYHQLLALVDDLREHPWKLMVRSKEKPAIRQP